MLTFAIVLKLQTAQIRTDLELQWPNDANKQIGILDAM